jgi:hypothetical protein
MPSSTCHGPIPWPRAHVLLVRSTAAAAGAPVERSQLPSNQMTANHSDRRSSLRRGRRSGRGARRRGGGRGPRTLIHTDEPQRDAALAPRRPAARATLTSSPAALVEIGAQLTSD